MLVSGVAGDVPGQVVGDLDRVRQVLLNLVGNAVKFTEVGQVVLDVTASGPDEVTLTVSDTGPGLPEDARELLFSPFVQVDPSTDRRHGGFGLGLAICSRLVALMEGRIGVESPRARGPGSSWCCRCRRRPRRPVRRRGRCCSGNGSGSRRRPRGPPTCCDATCSMPARRWSAPATTPRRWCCWTSRPPASRVTYGCGRRWGRTSGWWSCRRRTSRVPPPATCPPMGRWCWRCR